jgi:hypothetical protein
MGGLFLEYSRFFLEAGITDKTIRCAFGAQGPQ